MDVNYLLKDELEFELACRGIFNIGTVPPMKKILKEIIAQESTGDLSIKFETPQTCIEDPLSQIVTCESKIRVLSDSLKEILAKPDAISVRRIAARVLHLKNRIKLIPSLDEHNDRYQKLCEEIEYCHNCLQKLNDEEEECEEFSEHDKEILQKSLGSDAIKIIEKLHLSDAKVQPTTTTTRNNNEAHGHYIDNVLSRRMNYARCSTEDTEKFKRKLVPIKDWGIKFNGKDNMSINAFLERVEELKDARNAEDRDLWTYAIDFFEDDALIWFRANKDQVDNWKDLSCLLISTFQKPFYEDELLEEIRKRTQGKNESVAIYLAVMQNMFHRLSQKLTEMQKLNILLKNLQPYYQLAVCRDEFQSVSELTKILIILERTKLLCDNFQEPKSKTNSLEPDLAYNSNHANSELELQALRNSPYNRISGPESTKTATMKCWNCRSTGHSFKTCSIPRQRLFCYRCGKFGMTTINCTCNQSGNARKEVITPAGCLPK